MIYRSKSPRAVMLKIFYCFSALGLLVLFDYAIILNIPANIFLARTEITKESARRPFVFLTQTEQCLSPKLIQNLKLNTSWGCRCDVIVLSYKQECIEDKPLHFTYLFDRRTTWGSGRNLLFFHAMDQRPGYTYYIFTDDDVVLKFSDAYTPVMKQFTPISAFQNWLLDFEPAVGVVDYELRAGGQRVRNKMRTVCGNFNSTSLANPTIFFDPLFNAFHVNAVHHIFPLDTHHEGTNWWLTDKYVASVVELKFRGQALLFFPVAVENPLHRGYPKSLQGTKEAWQGFIDDVQKKAPLQYANHSLFEEYRKNPGLYVETSRTYCMKVTRHQPIVPFAHFAREK